MLCRKRGRSWVEFISLRWKGILNRKGEVDKYDHALRIAQILQRERLLFGPVVIQNNEGKVSIIEPIDDHGESETSESLP